MPFHSAEDGDHIWLVIASEPITERPYRDAHRWVFDQISFQELARFLELTAGTGLRLASMPGTFECEFYAVLQRAAPTAEARDELQQARLASLRERAARV